MELPIELWIKISLAAGQETDEHIFNSLVRAVPRAGRWTISGHNGDIVGRRLDLMIMFGYSVRFEINRVYLEDSDIPLKPGDVLDSNILIIWSKNGLDHRNDQPAVTCILEDYCDYDWLCKYKWMYHGKRHNLRGPAVMGINCRLEWNQNGLLHRTNYPASLNSMGNISWCRDGRSYRTDGPASISLKGNLYYHMASGCLVVRAQVLFFMIILENKLVYLRNIIMSLPTLMIKGKLAPPDGDQKRKRELDEWVPVEYIIEWFKTRLSKTGIENRVLILKSETASGKSTALPPEIYKSLVMGRSDTGIICTQPRVMTAIENVMEMLKHYSKILRLGDTIGWSTKLNKLKLTSAGLLSATIGTLAQQLRTLTDEEIIAKYRYILIDETHERDLQTDMTIYMLKNLLLRNQNNINCPFVVLMSATFDPQSFLDYFGVPLLSNFIWCVGETAGFDEMWDWNEGRTVNNYPQAAAQVVEKIIRAAPGEDSKKADILIFLPGAAEFKETERWLVKLNERFAAEDPRLVFSPLQIESTAVQTRNRDFMWTIYTPVTEQEVKIGGKTYIPTRRVILSTNVAETGLTLDNLKYVIDAGFNREIEYNPVLGIRGLITKPAPKSRIKQRKGRAGRKFRGVFYPLYPRFIHDKLPDLQFPQILIEDISIIMMDIVEEQLKVKQLAGDHDPQFHVADIDMIDVPSPDALAACIEKLYTLGLITMKAPKWSQDIDELLAGEEHNSGIRFGISKLGALAGRFSMLAPESVRMILSAYYWDCSVLDMITIAAYLGLDAKNFVGKAETVGGKMPPVSYINWQAVYKDGLPSFFGAKNMLFKVRLLLLDDFIHGAILLNAIKYILASAEPKHAIVSLQAWCSSNSISYKACIDLIRARDEIIEQFIAAGLDVFVGERYSIANTTEHDFMNTIAKVKHCIYDGYRNNLLMRHGSEYRTINGVRVVNPKLFQENEKRMAEERKYGFVLKTMPSVVMYRELSLKYNRKTMVYDVVVDRVSTCDGFVSIDPDFSI